MLALLLALLAALPLHAAQFPFTAESFLRGNLHTHTDQSDGDSPPADVLNWYAENGYDFLSLTDHDKLTRADAPAGLIELPGVELTSVAKRWRQRVPIHVNLICARRAAAGVKERGSPARVLADTINAARAAGGLTIVNHPNFGDALDAADLLAAPPFDMLEIASGHPAVHDEGGHGRQSAEQMWDALLTAGRRVYGVAVDDSHDFARAGEGRMPGRAWIELWGAPKDEASICAALSAGRFYSTTGVILDSLAFDGKALTLEVALWGKNDRVDFIGAGGKVLFRTWDDPAVYRLLGGEGYVRARVVQSGGRRAWTQVYPAP